MARYSGHTEPWGGFVDAKCNLPDVLAREVTRKPKGHVMVGTVCDPYQPAESEFRITRSVVRILCRAGWSFHVLTKSDLVVRDIDVFSSCPSGSVEITVTNIDPVAAFFEPGAATTVRRLDAIRELRSSGIEVSVFFGPILPGLADRPEQVDALFAKLKGLGVKHVMADKLNYLRTKYAAMLPWLRQNRSDVLPAFERALSRPEEYARELRATLADAFRRHELAGEVVF